MGGVDERLELDGHVVGDVGGRGDIGHGPLAVPDGGLELVEPACRGRQPGRDVGDDGVADGLGVLEALEDGLRLLDVRRDRPVDVIREVGEEGPGGAHWPERPHGKTGDGPQVLDDALDADGHGADHQDDAGGIHRSPCEALLVAGDHAIPGTDRDGLDDHHRPQRDDDDLARARHGTALRCRPVSVRDTTRAPRRGQDPARSARGPRPDDRRYRAG
jgi:hypothetical protein